MDLKDKAVVITGGGRGLGEELAKGFLKNGAKVLISDRGRDELQECAAEIGAEYFPADVTDEADMENLVLAAIQKFGRINIWINNAGVWLPHGPIENLDIPKVRTMIEANLLGTIIGTKVVLKEMRKPDAGLIINIISTSALEGRPGSAAYCASKFGVSGFTRSLILELKDSGIKAMGIYPGGMKTKLFEEKPPADYETYMEPEFVAQEIIKNLLLQKPLEEQIIRHD